MDKPPAKPEDLFARAIELPPGTGREQFVAAQCGANSALRREVESLLRAHEAAGDFLKPLPDRQTTTPKPPVVSPQGTAIMNAAVYAAAFLSSGRSETTAGRSEEHTSELQSR